MTDELTLRNGGSLIGPPAIDTKHTADWFPVLPPASFISLNNARAILAVESIRDRDLAATALAGLVADIKAYEARINLYIEGANELHRDLCVHRREELACHQAESKWLRTLILAFDDEEDTRRRKLERELTAGLTENTGAETTQVILPDHRAPAFETGVFSRSWVNFEIEDMGKFIQGLADGKTPRSYISINHPAIMRDIRKMGPLFSCPGIKVVQKKSLGVRARAAG